MNNIIKGDDLMLFDAQGKSIGLATSHTLSLSAESATINTKDHGVWGSTEVNKINWEISTDNLYSVAEFDTLFSAMVAGEAVEIYFGLKNEGAGTNGVRDTVDTDGSPASGNTQKTWTKKTTAVNDLYSPSTITEPTGYNFTGTYRGKAIITSLNANAASGDNATFSATFTGVGELSRVTA